VTKEEREAKAEITVHEAWLLYSDAEFVGRMAEVASAKLARGDLAGAKEDLALCEDHAGRVAYRHGEVRRMIAEAEKEAT
jgi:hypothetical protein